MLIKGEELIKVAYNVLFDRDPEPEGQKYWSNALQHGLQREEFLYALVSSFEFRTKVGATEGFSKYQDVDLMIPLQGHQFRVPAAELSLVPHLLNARIWEPHLTRYLRLNLNPTDIFMDVGANLGYFTIICAPLVRRLVAFEPVSTTYNYCKANIALNGLENVELYQYGLWNEDATTYIGVDSSNLMAASMSLEKSPPYVEAICCVSLDSMIRRGKLDIPRLDVIKMDIEGAEVLALKGMEQTIMQFRPKILMELNRPALWRFGKTVDDVWDWFRSISYKIAAFKHWEEIDPKPVESLEELKLLCPSDSLIDVLAVG
jgi:FkbM family methyltransferase